jgi:hypothetical protein
MSSLRSWEKQSLAHWPAALEKIIEVFSSTVGDLDRRGPKTSEALTAADFDTDNNERMEKEKERVKERGKGKGKGKAKVKETTTQQESKNHTQAKYKSKR